MKEKQSLRLVSFNNVSEPSYIQYIEEWEKSEEMIVPSATKRNELSFSDLQKQWTEDQTDIMYDKGLVPSTLYFLIDGKEHILGAIHLRHKLNDRLLENGGHIGYGVRPSERRKGYATIMLGELLVELIKKGYEKVLITCDDNNGASVATIEKNGGILWRKPLFEGILTRQYWIELEN